MPRTTSPEVLTTAFFALVLGATPALAAGEYPPCETFVLHGAHYEIASIDDGATGHGLGDERITRQELFDDDGNFAGTARLVHIVVEAGQEPGEHDMTLGMSAFTLPEGSIYGQVMMDRADDIYANELPTAEALIAVVGGTGAYMRSEGQIVVTFELRTVTPTRAEFQLHCD